MMMTETRADSESLAAFVARESLRDEPPQGATWGEWMKAKLKSAYRNPGRTPINNRQSTQCEGRALSDPFTDELDVLHFVREPYLTARQVLVIELVFRDDFTVEEVARRLNMARSTTSIDKHDALQTLIRIVKHDPGFMLPWRVYIKKSDAAAP